MSFETLPKGDSGGLFVFDKWGDLLIDRALDTGSRSNNLTLSGLVSTPHEVLYVGILIREPAGASRTSGVITYRLQITLDSPPAANEIGTVGIDKSTGVLGAWVAGVPNAAPYGVSAQGQSPSRMTNPGAVAVAPTTFDGSEARGFPSGSIAVGPLPTSHHEPAGGIFSDGRPTPRVDRVDDCARRDVAGPPHVIGAGEFAR